MDFVMCLFDREPAELTSKPRRASGIATIKILGGTTCFFSWNDSHSRKKKKVLGTREFHEWIIPIFKIPCTYLSFFFFFFYESWWISFMRDCKRSKAHCWLDIPFLTPQFPALSSNTFNIGELRRFTDMLEIFSKYSWSFLDCILRIFSTNFKTCSINTTTLIIFHSPYVEETITLLHIFIS